MTDCANSLNSCSHVGVRRGSRTAGVDRLGAQYGGSCRGNPAVAGGGWGAGGTSESRLGSCRPSNFGCFILRPVHRGARSRPPPKAAVDYHRAHCRAHWFDYVFEEGAPECIFEGFEVQPVTALCVQLGTRRALSACPSDGCYMRHGKGSGRLVLDRLEGRRAGVPGGNSVVGEGRGGGHPEAEGNQQEKRPRGACYECGQDEHSAILPGSETPRIHVYKPPCPYKTTQEN
jgi:hypothetical protein